MKLTKNFLIKNKACPSGIEWFEKCGEIDLLKVGLKAIEDGRGDYAEWLIRRKLKSKKRLSVKLAIYAAEQVISIYESHYPNDKRPRLAIKAAKQYLKTPTASCHAAARAACDAARAAARAACDAAWAAAWAAASNAKRKEMQIKIYKKFIKLLEAK